MSVSRTKFSKKNHETPIQGISSIQLVKTKTNFCEIMLFLGLWYERKSEIPPCMWHQWMFPWWLMAVNKFVIGSIDVELDLVAVMTKKAHFLGEHIHVKISRPPF